MDPKVAAQFGAAAGAADPPSQAEMVYLKNVVVPYNPPAGNDPELDIINHGTIAYVIIFDNGFKLAFRDSPGAVTDGERALMQKLGGEVNLGIIAYQGFGAKPVFFCPRIRTNFSAALPTFPRLRYLPLSAPNFPKPKELTRCIGRRFALTPKRTSSITDSM